jgi:hypothetical protein
MEKKQTKSTELPKECYITLKDVPVEEWKKLKHWKKDKDYIWFEACGKNEIVIVNDTEIRRWHEANPTAPT